MREPLIDIIQNYPNISSNEIYKKNDVLELSFTKLKDTVVRF
jgi:hypothetical protein